MNFDFPLAYLVSEALSGGRTRIVISYDVTCKYSVHFGRRFLHEDFPLIAEEHRKMFEGVKFIFVVPKFHIGAHVDACTDKHSLNYIWLVGQTCGEIVESNWSSLDRIATSLWEMGWGH